MKRIIITLLCIVAMGMVIVGCADEENMDKYMFSVENENGEGVEGVKLQVCTESTCQMIETDAVGIAVYDGEPAAYEVHIYDYPAGYYYDKDEVYITAEFPETVSFVLSFATENEETVEIAEDIEVEEETEDTEVIEETEDTEVIEEAEETELSAESQFPYAKKLYDVTPSSHKLSFSGTDINGNPIDSDIFADYDVTLVNIWEPWCGPCVNEMPEFEEVYEMLQNAGIKFNIIGFYSTEDDAKNTVKNLGITYPIVKDTGFFYEYQTGYVPTNIFVDSEGYILPVTEDEMVAIILYSVGSDDVNRAKEVAKDWYYSKGQTTSINKEILLQFLADRF